MTRIVPVGDVLSLQDPTSIDVSVLRARFAGQTAQGVTGPLHLSDDGRVLTINGTIAITFAGEVQIAAIRLLVAAHQGGKRVRAAALLGEAGSGARTLQQAFGKQWPLLRQHLVSRGGLWGFEV